MSQNHVLVYGCGKMARAFALGLQKANPQMRFSCWTPSGDKARALAQDLGGIWVQDLSQMPSTVDTVILGFKPQGLSTAAPDVQKLFPPATLFVSLLAAISLQTLSQYFPGHPLVRVMPNLAVETNQGVVLWKSHATSPAQLQLWQRALGSLGMAPELSEDHIDLYTMHSGSAPAFLYQWLRDAGVFAETNGGDPQLAVRIFAQALRGALSTELVFDELEDKIAAVTSKGGVTRAALDEWLTSDPEYLVRGFTAGLSRLKELKGS